jgi:formimidoylglutamate deiminase
MPTYFTSDALLPTGWARDVRIEVDARGAFSAVQANASAAGAERLAGPALPGMANLHSHAFQRAMAGLTETRGDPNDDFWTWRELMYRFVARLTPAQAEAIARHLYIEMLKHGYTAVGEFHYVHNDAQGKPYADPAEMLLRHLAAARDAGIAVTLLPSLYAWSGFGAQPLKPRQLRFASDAKAVMRMFEAARKHASDDVRAGVAPHSLRAADPKELAELVAALRAADAGAPIHMHAAEQTKEVEDCLAWSGKRPVEWLLENARLDKHWCVVHATHMSPGETAALAASGAVAGLCPSTEGDLGDGVFPMLGYRKAGGRWGIGGDSHVSRDPAEELRLAEYAQRFAARRRNLVVGNTSAAVGTTLWLEAAAGGAQALGRACGRIATGCRADLVVLDATRPDLDGRSGDAIANAFVFSGAQGLVRDVLVAGRFVIREGRHAGEEAAAASYSRAVRELLQ